MYSSYNTSVNTEQRLFKKMNQKNDENSEEDEQLSQSADEVCMFFNF